MSFNAGNDADVIHKAIKGLGTDEKTIIKIVGHRTKEQLRHIAHEYHSRHKNDLVKDIKGDTSGNFEEVLVMRFSSPDECRKWLLKKATKGAGTAEKYLIDVFAPATNEEILGLYQYDPQVITDVLNDVSSGNFSKVLREVLKGKRDNHVDEGQAEKDAERLYKAGEGKLGTDEDVFNDIFSHHGPNYLAKVDHYYSHKHKHTLETAVKKETSGNYEDLLVGLLKPKYVYYADRLFTSMKGLGTDEHALNHIMGILDLHELKEVAKIFHQRHNKSLADFVKGDTSGDYRELLLALLDN